MMNFPKATAAASALIAALVLVLAGCSTTPSAICPRVGVLDQASTVTRFAPGGGTTNNDVLFRADITKVDTDCKYSGSGNADLEANLRLYITAERGPALKGSVVNAEYFVVITDRGGIVLAKRTFPLKIDFGNLEAVNLTEGTWQYFRLNRGGGAGYEIWSGWQLSDAELQYNRSFRK
ncbi:MAG: hypothetical protein ACM3N5_01710 [Candidatus Eiseniibacteriota bacterium]